MEQITSWHSNFYVHGSDICTETENFLCQPVLGFFILCRRNWLIIIIIIIIIIIMSLIVVAIALSYTSYSLRYVYRAFEGLGKEKLICETQ